MSNNCRVDLNKPRWDQNTYWGRAKYFFTTTNPLNLFCSNSELEKAKDIVTKCRRGEDLPKLSDDEIWKYKHIYDSAFHPDTNEKMLLIGRMSAQVPVNMMITGSMLTFYKTPPQVIFWQWINQSFNAVVNYTNRSGVSPIPVSQLGLSYVMATGGALVTALGLNKLLRNAPPLIGRYVPFCAVASASCVNIPLMRRREMEFGIQVFDEKGKKIGDSKIAAKHAIGQVVVSRIGMAMPVMFLPPILMNHLEKKGVLKRYPHLSAPLQVTLCGVLLLLATPLCCALFPQKSSISVKKLEPEIQNAVSSQTARVYFNKGL